VLALRALADGLGCRNGLRGNREVLTPLATDPPSLIPVLVVASQLLRPGVTRGRRDEGVLPGWQA